MCVCVCVCVCVCGVCLCYTNIKAWYLMYCLMTEVNACLSSPCQNGGSCSDGAQSLQCACVSGYTGTICETGESLKMTANGIKF